MIYAELSGGLGNQMFVYAFARAMGLCCQEPVTLIDRQDWKTGSPAHTALALQATEKFGLRSIWSPNTNRPAATPQPRK